MKIYTITVVVIGLMFLFGIAGIPTNSSKVIAMFGDTNSSNVIAPATIGSDGSVTASGTGGFSGKPITILIILAAVVILVMATQSSISIGQFSLRISLESITAGFIGLIYGAFVLDLFSIVNLVGSLTNNTGWGYWITWSIIVPLIGGYTVAVYEFIRGGTD